MNTSLHSRIVLARRVAAACGTGVLLFGAAACGGSSDASNASGSANNSYGGQSGNQQPGQFGGQFPGANGQVAAISGSTAQVQSQQNGQVAVTWTTATTFTKQVAASLADVKVGDCVVVMPVASASSGSATAPSTPTTPPTSVTAASVRITVPVAGSCSASLRGGIRGGAGFGGGQSLGGGNPPAGGTAPGAGGFQGRIRGFGTFGKVTAVKANGFTVASTAPTSSPSGSTSTTTTTSVVVTTTASTTFAATVKAAASDVKVGVCVRAQGKTDDTGAVTAATISVTQPVGGQCVALFSRGAGGPGSGPGTGQAS